MTIVRKILCTAAGVIVGIVVFSSAAQAVESASAGDRAQLAVSPQDTNWSEAQSAALPGDTNWP